MQQWRLCNYQLGTGFCLFVYWWDVTFSKNVRDLALFLNFVEESSMCLTKSLSTTWLPLLHVLVQSLSRYVGFDSISISYIIVQDLRLCHEPRPYLLGQSHNAHLVNIVSGPQNFIVNLDLGWTQVMLDQGHSAYS